MRSLAIDLFCCLGGWAEGFLAEGYDVIGFDIERHRYAKPCPHCQGTGNFYRGDEDGDFLECDCYEDSDHFGKVFSAYPGQLVLQDVLTLHGSQFKDAAVIVASPPCTEFSYRGRYGRKRNLPVPSLGIELFNSCYRIAGESGRPVVIENVVWAQEFVGRAKTHWGSQYLWGDVPALLPHRNHSDFRKGDHTGLRSRFPGSRSTQRKIMTSELSKIPFL